MKHSTKQPNQFTQRFFKAFRCLSCGRVLTESENTRCWVCAGHHAIYGDNTKKKEVAA